jgi:ribose 5-phosphate isomerase
MDWQNSLIETLEWNKPIVRREEKEKVGKLIAEKVKDGDVLGVGSGSTSYIALLSIAEKMDRESLRIKAIPTSLEISWACCRLGIPITTLWEYKPDLIFDGADEIDPHHNMIKGRGGALFKEKLLIGSGAPVYIIADSSKMVPKLGAGFPVPVEVIPQALTCVEQALTSLNPAKKELRMSAGGKDGPVITENGNLILDVWFDFISQNLEKEIKSITGVVESGLFMGYKVKIIEPGSMLETPLYFA